MSLSKYIEEFSDKRIMVIGDVAADEFVIGKPERLSREAPVLILQHQRSNISPGCAANACNNISSLGGQARLVGLIGEDRAGYSLEKLLQEKGINTEGLIRDEKRPTSLKTRILAGSEQVVKQQVVRIDKLDKTPISHELEEILLNHIKARMGMVDGFLLSDYGNGLFTKRMKEELITLAHENDKLIAVDTRYNLLDFQGVNIATPNLEEAGLALGRELHSQDDVIQAGQQLITRMKADFLLITQGGEGMTLFTVQGDFTHIPVANFSEVFDVTGAGDTVVATFILASLTGADAVEAMKLANFAAGIVVRKNGVATVSPSELKAEVIASEK